MLRKIALTFLTLIGFAFSAPRVFAAIAGPPATSPLKYLSADLFSSRQILVASEHEVFHMTGGTSWQNLGRLNASGETIQRLVRTFSEELFVLTDRSLWRFDPAQTKWENVFERHSQAQPFVLSFAVWTNPETLWLVGTADGLFVSRDRGKTWTPDSRLPSHGPVTMVSATADHLFLISNRILYRIEESAHTRAVFLLPSGGASQEDLPSDTPPSPADSSESELLTTAPFRPVLISAIPFVKTLWLSTLEGVAQSEDEGLHWQMLPDTGLENTRVNTLAYAEKNAVLFAGTPSGAYAYRRQSRRWQALSGEASHRDTVSLAVLAGERESLAAVTSGELIEQVVTPEVFFQSPRIPSPEKESLFEQIQLAEPTMRSVQNAVVRYGNLSSEKIHRWQSESRVRALLPSFSLNRSLSRSKSIDLDRGGTADPDRYITGPEDVSHGFDVTVRWELSDLVWSSSQTSIDSREKLMIDQRRDFLAEATRIYYERRRLQAELLFSEPNELSLNYEKKLQLDELTGQLDALTGGWFEKALETRQRKDSE